MPNGCHGSTQRKQQQQQQQQQLKFNKPRVHAGNTPVTFLRFSTMATYIPPPPPPPPPSSSPPPLMEESLASNINYGGFTTLSAVTREDLLTARLPD